MKCNIIRSGRGFYLDEEDIPIVSAFNSQTKNSQFNLLTQLQPEPFIGNPETARVIFLALNPGSKGKTDKNENEDYWHNQSDFVKAIRDCQRLAGTDFPYYYLDNTRFSNSPGHIWTKRIFRELIDKIGQANLAKKICCVQYHGYHSNKYKPLTEILPSQKKINFQIVGNAIDKKLPIIIMRSVKIWTKSIDKLKDYRYLSILKNFRNPTISPNNMEEGQFDKLVELIGKP